MQMIGKKVKFLEIFLHSPKVEEDGTKTKHWYSELETIFKKIIYLSGNYPSELI